MRLSRLSAILVLLLVHSAQAQEFKFSWDQATVYRIVTDRFSNGDSSNDYAYGRGLDGNGNSYAIDSTGHFLGGDFAGIKGWIEDGYFSDLGVNVLWLSAPYEQVHGWVGGGDGDFQLYAYEASWPLDYTEVDRAFGSKSDFQDLVDTAHQNDLRVILDVDLGNVGPPTLHDMASFGFGGLTSDEWRSWTPSSKIGWQSYQREYVTFTDSLESWGKWWGPDWVRSNLVGYEPCSENDGAACQAGEPALRSDIEVSEFPQFLQLKWGEEKSARLRSEMDTYFSRSGIGKTAANHVVLWLSSWVREFGIDGFHLTDAGSIDPAISSLLKKEASSALEQWKNENPDTALDDKEFWMTGDMAGRDSYPDNYGYDAVHRSSAGSSDDYEITSYFEDLVSAVGDEPSKIVTHLSANDVPLYDRTGLWEAGTRFLLAPGPVTIYYGDETARNPGAAKSDSSHAANSFMNWAEADEAVLAHWQKIGAFRAAHPAVARGGYDIVQESPYAFHRGVRLGADSDQVVIVMGAAGKTRINVSIVWPDDTLLRDAYTGNIAIVSFGQVTFDADASGILLLEEMPLD